MSKRDQKVGEGGHRMDWTYIDIMATALAMVPERRLYAADEKWNAAWEEILESDEAKKLLPEVTFACRDPYPALSEEVEVLRRVLQRASVLSLGNPRYSYFSVDPKARQEILEENRQLRQAYPSQLAAMAEVLKRELAAAD